MPALCFYLSFCYIFRIYVYVCLYIYNFHFKHNPTCFLQCILMEHSPLAWFQMLSVLQLPRNRGGGEEGMATPENALQANSLPRGTFGQISWPRKGRFCYFSLSLSPTPSSLLRLLALCRPGNTGVSSDWLKGWHQRNRDGGGACWGERVTESRGC